MYFREEGASLSLETYFNAFSIGKWRKYTGLQDLHLKIQTDRPVEIKAYNAIGKSENPETDNTFFSARNGNSLELAKVSVERKEVAIFVEAISVEENQYEVTFKELPDDGILYIKCSSKASTVPQVISGYYYTDTKVVNDKIKLALGICTFKREEFLNRNLLDLKKGLLDNSESILNGKMKIYVADNGNTINETNPAIDQSILKDDNIRFYPNKNAGGASGFTRTMIEALYHDDENFSHIILMDDDIVLSTDVLERTYTFLSYIKAEYSKAMLGASMFSLDERNIQVEAGAQCRGLKTGFYHKMWDMNEADAVSANEEYNPFNYSGWWYNVIPTDVVKENGLPLPLFIHYDDIEYGMRNSYKGNETILINGICVWHPQGLGKANVSMKYYDVRNVLIAMSGTTEEVSARAIKSNMFQRVVSGILRYRYNDAYAAMKAVDDYYKGPQRFDKIDPEVNHKEVMGLNYKSVSPEEAGVSIDQNSLEKDLQSASNKYLSVMKCAICQLFPSVNKTKIAEIIGLGMADAARRIYHYDRENNTGVLLERDRKEVRKILKEYMRVSKIIKYSHVSAPKQWADYKVKATSLEHWNDYLGIK